MHISRSTESNFTGNRTQDGFSGLWLLFLLSCLWNKQFWSSRCCSIELISDLRQPPLPGLEHSTLFRSFCLPLFSFRCQETSMLNLVQIGLSFLELEVDRHEYRIHTYINTCIHACIHKLHAHDVSFSYSVHKFLLVRLTPF